MKRFLIFTGIGITGVLVSLAFLSTMLICACSTKPPTPTKLPTITPTPNIMAGLQTVSDDPAVVLTASAETVTVGEIVWVQLDVFNLGMPQYTITMTPGGTYLARYGVNAAPDVVQMPAEPLIFEFVSPNRVLFGRTPDGIPLRAARAGSVVLTVNVSGETHFQQIMNGTPMEGFYFTAAAASITLTAAE